MPDLLVTSNGQPDRDGALIKVTPESAGWEYVGFEVLRIEAGRSANRHYRERRGVPGPSLGDLHGVGRR